jgi:hypothetical protein
VETPHIHELYEKEAKKQGLTAAEVEANYVKVTPIRRVLQADEMGWIIAFLASPRSGSITGVLCTNPGAPLSTPNNITLVLAGAGTNATVSAIAVTTGLHCPLAQSSAGGLARAAAGRERSRRAACSPSSAKGRRGRSS